MTLLPELRISLANGFWFSLLFIATNILFLKAYPSHYKTRVLAMPKFDNKFLKIVGLINYILFQGLIFIIVFIPLKFDFFYFGPGLILFISGYIAYITSLINYASSDPDRPVTTGIYKYSRNPQQLSTMWMWIGIGMMSSSFLIILICLIQLITVYPTFLAQEKYCIQKYGKSYIDYMKKTPRYFICI
jgi:protein-S-isoprenylcysteine O-methyltransferase Ste14